MTLPVEVDASHRALVWLKSSVIKTPATQEKAYDTLKWAAHTYSVAAIASLATHIYCIVIWMGEKQN
ncbi:zinc metallopeptidase [Williamwhitmania taraxaci]|uniref:zinc metallopeptidase n=1 Tax=Williamwhitmania taraxaci TaxID=1640674 RepID=UPI000B83455B|nr:zinc metallopeptidase [Williamwhitmania taraxaci]